MTSYGDTTNPERTEVTDLGFEDCAEGVSVAHDIVKAVGKITKRSGLKRTWTVQDLVKVYETAAKINSIHKDYEKITKMILEKRLYGTPENFREQIETWIEEWLVKRQPGAYDNWLVPPEGLGYEPDVESNGDHEEESELYVSVDSSSSGTEAEENIYEEMSPNSLALEAAEAEEPGKDEENIYEFEDGITPMLIMDEEDKHVEINSLESDCGCSCFCSKVVKPEGSEKP